MNNIIRLKTEKTDMHQSMLSILSEIGQMVNEGKISQLCICAKQTDQSGGEIVTGWSGVNPCEMQNLVSHLQCEVIFECIQKSGR